MANLLYEQHVYSQKVFGHTVLIRPFVFYYVDDANEVIYLDFDLSRWFCEEKVEIEENSVLSHQSRRFYDFLFNVGLLCVRAV